MTQPSCDGFEPLPDVVDQVPSPYVTPLVILGLLILIAVVDVWLYRSGHGSISRWILKTGQAKPWFRWLVGLGLFALGWHWLWGFPGK